MKKSIIHFFAFIAAYVGCVCAFDIPNSLAKTTIEDVNKLAEFSQKSGSIYSDYVAILNSTMELDENSEGIRSGDVRREYGIRIGEEKIIRTQLILNTLDQRLDSLIKPEIKIKKWITSSQKIIDFLYRLRGQVYDFFDDSKNLFSKVRNDLTVNDDEEYRRFVTRTLILLRGEIEIVDFGLLNVTYGSPEYFNRKIMIFGNKFIISLFESMLSRYNGEISQHRFEENLDINLSNLYTIENFIKKGRISVKKMIKKISSIRKGSKNFKVAILDALKTYLISFDNEIRISNTLRELSESLVKENTQELIIEAYLKEAVKLEVLVNQRMSLQAQRQALMAEVRR